MFLQVLALLALVAGQAQGPGLQAPSRGDGAQIPAGMTMLPPDERGWQRCMRPLAADGTANSSLTVRCARVVNGEPKDCVLATGQDAPVRHRAAARCLAPLHRFVDAQGQPANGGEVVIPVRLSFTLTIYH
ncbi:MAG: hypothetical protein EON87_14630 [Brevundimonas sp.]|nr:MAG: hypothetical protein EON87_14630 [Brevundimonas sp.]